MSDNDAFVDFLLSMCWVVSLDTHRGWKGVHPDADVFPKVLYYSDTLSELVLDCPSLVHDIPVSQHRASRTSAKTNNAKTRSHWSLSHSGNHTPTHPTLTRRPLHTYTHTHTHTSSIVKGSSGANRGTVLSNNGRGGVASRTLSSPVPLRLADFVPDGDVPPATPRPRFEEESSLLGDADSRQPSKTTLGDRTTALSMPGSPVIRINDHSQSHSSPGRPIAPVITLDEARAQADSGDDTPTPIPAHNRRQKYSHKGAEMEKGTDAVTYNARHSKNTPTRLDNRNSPSDSDETSEELSRRSSETLTVFAETTTSVLRTGEDNIRRRPKSEGTPKLVGDVERPPALGSRYMSFDKLTSNDKEHMRQRLEDDSNSDPDADGKQRLSRNNSPTLGDGDVSIADIETTNHSIVRKCDQIANSFVVVVWLDNFDDYVFFPFKDNEKLRLYVHPLPSGLFRIKVESAVLEGPLFDGMIVSRSVLGPLMRQTALNALRRKRLNTEKTGSRREEDVARPHHLRKSKIDDIIHKHASENSLPEFYEQLLKPLHF
ncbi:hypothetical protein SARC_08630 [Sphaeroforma arctica JP610]|uniref:Rap-GAP domain-containing protein n=1 Tax=Sphaeroforma arctica JP610 TaxID=667725 RepID=A0A0L0FQ87_9EUKA|nr:hypothetical protein SARC_08630 [Sphaeroforma arctica JP610]KNC78952.1 hypothetical protein SARC_08630 [Sphaeroforma arctica JP610]|eukprot:XP_014152854.1 hypothetical protein SARC_08630 [Sphaeroforma arctica JP610]